MDSKNLSEKLNSPEYKEKKRKQQEEIEKRIKSHRHWIDTINEEGKELTDWELNFMKSITYQFNLYENLSEKQASILERIYTEKTRM